MTVTLPFVNRFVPKTFTTADQLNALIDAINVLPRGFVGQAQGTDGTVLSGAVGTQHFTKNPVTFTVAAGETRRMEIINLASFVMSAGTNGRYVLQSAYTSGSSQSVAAANLIGPTAAVSVTVVGTNGQSFALTTWTATFTAGQWTAYGMCNRASGGDPTDVIQGSATVVLDDGAA